MKLRRELAEKLKCAVDSYPLNAWYEGKITPEERAEIENRGFEVKTFSVYADGSGIYAIKDKEQDQ